MSDVIGERLPVLLGHLLHDRISLRERGATLDASLGDLADLAIEALQLERVNFVFQDNSREPVEQPIYALLLIGLEPNGRRQSIKPRAQEDAQALIRILMPPMRAFAGFFAAGLRAGFLVVVFFAVVVRLTADLASDFDPETLVLSAPVSCIL